MTYPALPIQDNHSGVAQFRRDDVSQPEQDERDLIVGDSDRYYSFSESGSMRPTYSGLAG